MAPKKTKEQKEAEKAAKAEAARIAEEEKQRLAEEERKRQEELEAQRQEALAAYMAIEAERVAAENDELAPVLGAHEGEMVRVNAERASEREWDRHIACKYLPKPWDLKTMRTYIEDVAATQARGLDDTFATCADLHDLATQCLEEALQAPYGADTAHYFASADQLRALISKKLDAASARVLMFMDEYFANGEVKMMTKQPPFTLGVWVNLAKNPRFRLVEFPALGVTVEIPKPVALASLAVRVQQRAYDERYGCCTNAFMALGGVLQLDLLALPGEARMGNHWTVRQVGPLARCISSIPYPMPPAGVDPETYVYDGEEEIPPFRITMALPPDIIVPSHPQVGWWDSRASCWSTADISEITYDPATRLLAFCSTHIGALALLQSRVRATPYYSWSVRPTGGENGKVAEVTLQVPGTRGVVVIEATTEGARLVTPHLPALSTEPLHPQMLLRGAADLGLPLFMEDRDVPFAGVTLKERSVERAMCMDAARIANRFLLAHSRWNLGLPPHEVLLRVSEVTDWEVDGRTELDQLVRIFAKEKTSGDKRVLPVLRRGDRGVAFCDALNKLPAYPALPDMSTLESVQKAGTMIQGEVHASLLTLLRGTQTPALQALEEAAVLCATAEGLEQARNVDPQFSFNLGELLWGLRVFTFGCDGTPPADEEPEEEAAGEVAAEAEAEAASQQWAAAGEEHVEAAAPAEGAAPADSEDAPAADGGAEGKAAPATEGGEGEGAAEGAPAEGGAAEGGDGGEAAAEGAEGGEDAAAAPAEGEAPAPAEGDAALAAPETSEAAPEAAADAPAEAAPAEQPPAEAAA